MGTEKLSQKKHLLSFEMDLHLNRWQHLLTIFYPILLFLSIAWSTSKLASKWERGGGRHYEIWHVHKHWLKSLSSWNCCFIRKSFHNSFFLAHSKPTEVGQTILYFLSEGLCAFSKMEIIRDEEMKHLSAIFLLERS